MMLYVYLLVLFLQGKICRMDNLKEHTSLKKKKKKKLSEIHALQSHDSDIVDGTGSHDLELNP